MEIVSALFVESFQMRQVAGPSTRIDLSGVFFSVVAPSPPPVTLEPHLLAFISCGPDEPGNGVFEVIFRKGSDEDDEQVARNVSPFTVEPGRFTYRLVRGELEFAEYGTVVAHCRIDRGPWHRVPLTLIPPA